MNCPQCKNSNIRVQIEQAGVNKKGEIMYGRIGYCDVCKIRFNADNPKGKKKDSFLSVLSIILTVFTFTSFLRYIGFILALIDLGLNDETKKHSGSVFTIVFTILCTVYFFDKIAQLIS